MNSNESSHGHFWICVLQNTRLPVPPPNPNSSPPTPHPEMKLFMDWSPENRNTPPFKLMLLSHADQNTPPVIQTHPTSKMKFLIENLDFWIGVRCGSPNTDEFAYRVETFTRSVKTKRDVFFLDLTCSAFYTYGYFSIGTFPARSLAQWLLRNSVKVLSNMSHCQDGMRMGV